MMKTNSKTSMILLISILLTHLSCATITIEITPTEVTTNANFIISCYVGTLTQDVIFFKDNIEIGKCTPSPLPGVVPIFCVSGFSQDPTTNITKYSVTTANATINEGTWKCVHNTETSNTLPLTVYGFPSNPIDSNQAYLPNKIDATNMDSTQFTVNVSECVNPAPTISWTFYQKCDGTSINSIPITSTTSDDPDVDCSSPYSAYKNTVKVSDMKKLVDGDLCLNVRSVVGYTGTSFSNKIVTFLQNITFTSPTVTTEMSSASTSKDQTTRSQNPSTAIFYNTQKIERTNMNSTVYGITSTSLHVSSEVTTQNKINSDFSIVLPASIISSILLFVLLILGVWICCRCCRDKTSKNNTSKQRIRKTKEKPNHIVNQCRPKLTGNRFGFNGINNPAKEQTRDSNQYPIELDQRHTLRSTHQSDYINYKNLEMKYPTEESKYKPRQTKNKHSHEFLHSKLDHSVNKYDINEIDTSVLPDYNHDSKRHFISAPHRFDHQGYYLTQQYRNHNRRCSPYMPYVCCPLDSTGLIFYQGHRKVTNKH